MRTWGDFPTRDARRQLRGSIGSSYDNGGVHYNSGIQNKAFYLLAEGGTHPQSGITVNGIGRPAAEYIFYRTLDAYVGPNSQFIDIRNACVWAAGDIYGHGSTQYLETQRAWEAVGVATTTPRDGVVGDGQVRRLLAPHGLGVGGLTDAEADSITRRHDL